MGGRSLDSQGCGVPSVATPLLAAPATEGKVDSATLRFFAEEERKRVERKEMIARLSMSTRGKSLRPLRRRLSGAGKRGRRRNFLEVARCSGVLTPRFLVVTLRHRAARAGCFLLLRRLIAVGTGSGWMPHGSHCSGDLMPISPVKHHLPRISSWRHRGVFLSWSVPSSTRVSADPADVFCSSGGGSQLVPASSGYA